MNSTHEIEIPYGDDELLVELDLEVYPGSKGSYNYNAASDVDYYGEAAFVEFIEGIGVYDDDTKKFREPTAAERLAVEAWAKSKEGEKALERLAEKAVEDDFDELAPDRGWDSRYDD